MNSPERAPSSSSGINGAAANEAADDLLLER
ncbi:hypothetical protein BJ969_003612 [Saccharopolyspora gloriosae]|uniref:Uncharacterized protein n=1 Tax=Saccharopolyspora gloriosae TaxID=455344 RepID=A0A840NG08_9PSEU|nr:hypothetical protein [Saccharopolyspora gloriosae]